MEKYCGNIIWKKLKIAERGEYKNMLQEAVEYSEMLNSSVEGYF
jgi:hypothetical protein